MIKRKNNSIKDRRKLKPTSKQTWKTKIEVQNFRNACYVDETIINNKEVVYGPLMLNNYPPSSVDELKKLVRKNIHLVKSEKSKQRYLRELKSHFFKFTKTTHIAKLLINRFEIKSFKLFSSKDASTELKNRDVALEKLIRKVQCKNIVIDNYDNPDHKKRMIRLGRRFGKNVSFVDSGANLAVQFADIPLLLF